MAALVCAFSLSSLAPPPSPSPRMGPARSSGFSLASPAALRDTPTSTLADSTSRGAVTDAAAGSVIPTPEGAEERPTSPEDAWTTLLLTARSSLARRLLACFFFFLLDLSGLGLGSYIG